MYKNNHDQIPDLLKFVRESGIDALIFHRLFNAYNVCPALEYLSNKEEHEKHSYPCRVVKNSIFVSVACEVTHCCFLPEFSLGNALENGPEELMQARAYRDFVRNMKSHPVCKKCQW